MTGSGINEGEGAKPRTVSASFSREGASFTPNREAFYRALQRGADAEQQRKPRVLRRFVARGGELVEVERVIRETR